MHNITRHVNFGVAKQKGVFWASNCTCKLGEIHFRYLMWCVKVYLTYVAYNFTDWVDRDGIK